MLVRGSRRLLPIIGPIFIVIFIVFQFHDEALVAFPFGGWTENGFSIEKNGQHSYAKPFQDITSQTTSGDDSAPIDEDLAHIISEHREVFSVSTTNKKYFMIEFDDRSAVNPNIIPHPSLKDTWIIVAQKHKSSVKNSVWFAELVCNAAFKNGVLGCIEPPLILPIAATPGNKCEGDLDYFSLNVGPHDARVFYGPRTPYAMYGSNSMFTCFGQWMLDFRVLVDWGFEISMDNKFRLATEVQRPVPYGQVEKNWFLFWDKNEQMYVHYDVTPKRSFAKLEIDGSVGQNLAPLAAASDDICMAKYMPQAVMELESVHQATNSLSITLCKRSDSSCIVDDSNTFIFTIFQYKTFYSFHSVYEPYVMLFRQTAPFEIYGVSTKPFWIHGRGKLNEDERPAPVVGEAKPWNPLEMFYITSMSWKTHGQKYHGYIDDVLFIGFGIEDSRTAGIDIMAGDLMMDLGFCSNS